MAEPFVYVPEAYASLSIPEKQPKASDTPQASRSPRLSPSPTKYPSSPYLGVPSSGAGSAASSSIAFNPNSVLWPDAPQYGSTYTVSWISLVPQATFSQPSSFPSRHNSSRSHAPRRRSRMNKAHPNHKHDIPIFPQTSVHIHPLLNGDAPAPAFYFDLAPSAFTPLRLIAWSSPQRMPLGAAEMHEQAFHPARRSLRVLHPKIPFWPIDLARPKNLPPLQRPPLSLGEVLFEMHRALHLRITAADWAPLGIKERERVTVAFIQRCRTEAVRSGVPPALLRDREIAERAQGVKRIDFLLGKTVFKGFVRTPGDPEGCVRMVTA